MEDLLLPRLRSRKLFVQEGLIPCVARQNDGLLEGERLLRFQVAALDLDDDVVSVGHSPALGGNVIGGPLAKVLEAGLDLLVLDSRFPPLQADPGIGRKGEFGHDLELHDGMEGPVVLVMGVTDHGDAHRLNAGGLDLLFEGPGDQRVRGVLADLVEEHPANKVPRGLALPEPGQLGLRRVFREDRLRFGPDGRRGDREIDLPAARADGPHPVRA